MFRILCFSLITAKVVAYYYEMDLNIFQNSSSAGLEVYGDVQDNVAHAGMAGDVNGDGIGDYILSAPGKNSNAGAVYVIFGIRNDIFSSNIDLSAFTSGSAGYIMYGGW